MFFMMVLELEIASYFWNRRIQMDVQLSFVKYLPEVYNDID